MRAFLLVCLLGVLAHAFKQTGKEIYPFLASRTSLDCNPSKYRGDLRCSPRLLLCSIY